MITRRSLVILVVCLVASACVNADDNRQGATDGSTPSTLRSSNDQVSADVSTTIDRDPVPIDRPGPLIGIAVPGGRAVEVRDVELVTGATFDIIRMFVRWDDTFPSPDSQSLIEANRRLHLSIRPVDSSGAAIPWAELATAQPGEDRYDELVQWIDRVVALGPGTYFTINHEPETADSRSNGTADDFIAMWRRTVDLLRERGGTEIRTVWTMTNGAFSDGRASEWYPGDDVVDVIGADIYNWFTCQGTDRPWQELDALMAPALAFAQNREKPLALPEFGSVEDRSNLDRKADWIVNAERTLLVPDVAAAIEFVIWFDVTAPGGTWPDCVWDYDTSPASRDAFSHMMLSLRGDA